MSQSHTDLGALFYKTCIKMGVIFALERIHLEDGQDKAETGEKKETKERQLEKSMKK
jgi:hypothetical protein